MRVLNGVWLLVGALGAALCLALLLATFARGPALELAFRTLISQQVSKQVGHAVDAFDERFVKDQADGLRGRLGEQARILRERIQRELPAQVEAQVARMQDPNCECRRILNERLASIELQMQRLPDFIQRRYAETVRGLLGELRLFSGINAASFVLVAIAGWLGLRGQLAADTRRWLTVAAGLLLIATGLAGYLYLFNQNWLETLLFNRWVGWGYATGLGLLFIWLCDLVLNRARMTRELLSNAASGIGNITPC